MRAKRKALRTKVQRALKGGYLRGQILFGILYLDFNLDAAGKFELHQCVDRLGVRAVDVDETLVGRNFELLAALLVDEGRTVDGENALARGEGDGTAHDGAGGFHVGNNLFCRFLNERVVVALEFDADLLTHLLFELNFALRQWDKSRSLSHCADKIGILLGNLALRARLLHEIYTTLDFFEYRLGDAARNRCVVIIRHRAGCTTRRDGTEGSYVTEHL